METQPHLATEQDKIELAIEDELYLVESHSIQGINNFINKRFLDGYKPISLALSNEICPDGYPMCEILFECFKCF